ncbi:MAG TPA: sugar ABC transporter permease [Clostridiales bacterium]|nr:sugar ABC transporter permease [Clostridiales bacterium]
MLIMTGYPLVRSIVMAFLNYKLTEPNNIYFAGLKNFISIFQADPHIPMILLNTIKWVFISVGCQFLLGMILALALKKPFKGRNLYQSIVFLPWAFSSFAVGIMFRWCLNGEYGIVNHVLMQIGLISEKISWLGSSDLALISVIMAMVWIGVPFFAIMYLAALQSIPSDVYEAATIDGCSRIKGFFLITIPYITPTMITTLLLRTIWVFNAIEMIMIMTGGGPAYSSETITSYMYTKAYGTQDFGTAAAMGLLVMIVLMLYSTIFLRSTRYEESGDF